MINKKEARWLCGVFILIWMAVTAISLFAPEKVFSKTENRYLQTRPDFSWKALKNGSFGEDYEAYIADQFPGRDSFVTVKTYAERARGMMDMSGVFFGRDGYLLENDGLSLIENAQAQKNVESLMSLIDSYGQEMTSVSVLFVPSGSSVLENKLPAFAPVYSQEKWICHVYDQIESLSSYGGNIRLIQVFDSLLARQEDGIYYRTDHHWTTGGAFTAYVQWAKSLGLTPFLEEDFNIETVADDFYGTLYSKVHAFGKADSIQMYTPKNTAIHQVMTLSGISDAKRELYDFDALKTWDKYAFFLGGNYGLAKIETTGSNGVTDKTRRLLVVKDSFANCFIPFAALHFEETYVTDLRYTNMDVSKIIEDYGITDILILYNVKNFSEDKDVFQFR